MADWSPRMWASKDAGCYDGEMHQRANSRRSRHTTMSSVVVSSLMILGASATAAEPGADEQTAFRVTGVLLLDRPAQSMAAQLIGRDEAKSIDDFQLRIGNWDPRDRVTQHRLLPRSAASWRFSTGLNEWRISPQEQIEFAHHVFIVDRPFY